MTKIFIDGSAGTTGLRIRERLADREGLDILTLPEELRKQQGDHGLQLLGCRDGVEGFFIARMRRVR